MTSLNNKPTKEENAMKSASFLHLGPLDLYRDSFKLFPSFAPKSNVPSYQILFLSRICGLCVVKNHKILFLKSNLIKKNISLNQKSNVPNLHY